MALLICFVRLPVFPSRLVKGPGMLRGTVQMKHP